MIPRPRLTARASLLVVMFCVVRVFGSAPAMAIQLRWSTGSTDLTVNQNTQALLVVQADSAEVALPNSWRLQWTADSLGIQFSPFEQACLVDTAKVDSIVPPSTPADSAANQVTAYFCSSGSSSATTATWIIDLPAGGHGKLKVVALDPADTSLVISSNEVTFNGGIDGDYSPAILSVTTSHATAQFAVSVVGTDLSSNASLRITVPDRLWSVPLTVTGQTASMARGPLASSRARASRLTQTSSAITITAVADLPMLLPAAIVEVGQYAGATAMAPVPGDQIDALSSSLPDTVLFRDPNWTAAWATTVYPKDFAFFYNVVAPGGGPWRGLFHLIYIRHNNNYSGDAAESLLVHAWSPDLRNWKVDKRAFAPDTAHGNAWDHLHVWAPSLLSVGNQVYMFYTGVDANHNQRIGYVTTSLLDTSDTQWSTTRTEVYSAGNTSWADPVGHVPDFLNQQQFRDPWVMPDPDHAGKYLLFNVGEDLNPLYNGLGYTIIGVAQNASSTLNSWVDLGPYRATDFGNTSVSRSESPLVVRDSTDGAPWRIFVANGPYNNEGTNSTYFVSESLGVALSDTSAAKWPGFANLYSYLGDDGSLIGWQSCEHIQIGPYHFFAGYNGDGIAITRTQWDPATQTFKIGDPVTGVGGNLAEDGLRFTLLNFRPGVRTVRFGLEATRRVSPRLALYDLAGRRVRVLLDGRILSGRQEVQWDCRDAAGSAVPAGIYFARLTGVGPQQVRRVVVVR
ncbi:MAG: hypothetical protein IT348_20190 [Candidatus Eisenbacteria bacterium]|nr:hypothetical protein [Candidatus Eisenbacteria bacterium]